VLLNKEALRTILLSLLKLCFTCYRFGYPTATV